MENDILQSQGVNSKGFGTIPKLVMQDRRLTAYAKAIYSYFCSYAGASKTAFPRSDKIISDLVMGRNTYYKHFNMLKEFGYIKVEQEKSKEGHFSRNVYTLIQNIPCGHISDTAVSHAPDNTGLNHAQPCTNYRGTDKRDTDNQATNINSLKINSSKINSEREAHAHATEYGEFRKVRLTTSQYDALIAAYGRDKATDYISQLDSAIECGYKAEPIKHYATIKRWIHRDENKPQGPQQRQSKPNRIVNCPSHKRDYAELERMEQQLLAEGR